MTVAYEIKPGNRYYDLIDDSGFDYAGGTRQIWVRGLTGNMSPGQIVSAMQTSIITANTALGAIASSIPALIDGQTLVRGAAHPDLNGQGGVPLAKVRGYGNVTRINDTEAIVAVEYRTDRNTSSFGLSQYRAQLRRSRQPVDEPLQVFYDRTNGSQAPEWGSSTVVRTRFWSFLQRVRLGVENDLPSRVFLEDNQGRLVIENDEPTNWLYETTTFYPTSTNQYLIVDHFRQLSGLPALNDVQGGPAFVDVPETPVNGQITPLFASAAQSTPGYQVFPADSLYLTTSAVAVPT